MARGVGGRFPRFPLIRVAQTGFRDNRDMAQAPHFYFFWACLLALSVATRAFSWWNSRVRKT